MLVNFMGIWSILWTLGYFVAIWNILPMVIWYTYVFPFAVQRKIWQPFKTIK
jgi:hypothetical protein